MTQNIRQELTETFAAAIEKGCPPWRAGWTTASPPINPSTGNAYNGMNRLLLMQAVADCDGEYRFMTLKQASAMGYSIKRGAKAFRIVRVAEVDRKPDEKSPVDGEVVAEDKAKRLILRVHHVFNGKDIQGLPPAEKRENHVQPVDAAERIVAGLKGTGLVFLEGGDKACYIPKLDTIRMPDRWRFKGGNGGVATAEYWATLLHECGHSSMSPKRLDRNAAKFGTDGYAREELRVEIASAFLCQELGIPLAASLLDSHSSYLASWASVLRSDPQEIFRAAAEAQKIADYLKSISLAPEVKAVMEDVKPVAAPPTEMNIVTEAANQPEVKRRRVGMRM